MAQHVRIRLKTAGLAYVLIALLLAETFTVLPKAAVGQTPGFAPVPELPLEPYGPRMDAYVVKILKTKEARIAAFEAGDIDEVGGLEPADVDRIRKNRPDAFFLLSQDYGIVPLQFNVRRYPISEKPIRQALAHIVDRDFVVTEILKGLAAPVYSAVLPIYGDWFNPNVKPYDFGLQKAEQVLDSAGFKRGADGFRIDPKTGQPLKPIELITVTEGTNPFYFRVGRYIISQAEKIGVKVTHTTVTTAIYTQRIPNQEFDMYFNGWSLAIYPTFMARFFHSRFDVKLGTNRYGVRDKVVDELSDQMLNAPTEAEAKQILWKLQEVIQDIIPWVPVYSAVFVTGYSGKVKGLVLDKLKGLPFPVGTSFFHYLAVRKVPTEIGGEYDDVSSAEFANLNPMYYLFVNEGFILSRIFEPLAALDPLNLYGPRIPRLAQTINAEVITEAGKKVTRITVDFVKNATWHDGTPVTAADLDWTVKVPGLQWKTRRHFTDYAETIGKIIRTEVPNPHTWIGYIEGTSWVHVAQNIPGYRVLPKHVWEKLSADEAKATDPSVKDLPGNPALKMLIGAGAWILKEHIPGTSVALIWNPVYFRPNPEKTLRLDIRTSDTRYDDERLQVTVKVTNYLQQEVANAKVTVRIVSGNNVFKEVEATNVGGGTYVADLGTLPPDEGYQLQISATAPLIGVSGVGGALALSKKSVLSFRISPAYAKYLVPAGIAAFLIIVAVLFALVRKRRRAAKVPETPLPPLSPTGTSGP